MKIFLRVLIGFTVLIIAVICFIFIAWNKKFDAPYQGAPAPVFYVAAYR